MDDFQRGGKDFKQPLLMAKSRDDDCEDDFVLSTSVPFEKGGKADRPPAYREGAECRFCHEGEGGSGGGELAPDHLIGPCSCRGSVQWVHRGCLDQWRAVSVKRSSFSTCDLCHTDYQMEFREEGTGCARLKVATWITLDLTLFILAVNAVAALCSLFVWVVDRDRQRDKIFTDTNTSVPPALLVDWLFGWLLFFFILGLLGLVYAIARWCCGCSCNADTCCYGPAYSPHYGHGDCYFFWCFVPDWSCHSGHYGGGSSGDCGSCGNCGGGSCGGGNCDCKDGGEVLLAIVAAAIIILIIFGFFVGVGLAIMVGVKIVKRRVDVIHNKHKAGQWVVLDLTAMP